MLAFSIFITHGLACYVAIDITWNEYLAKRFPNNTSFWEYVTRTLLVFATCKPKSTNNVTSSSCFFCPLSPVPQKFRFVHIAHFVRCDAVCGRWILSKFANSLIYSKILFSIVLLAVAIPNLELFISLFGALCLSALGLAFPAIIQTCVFWNSTSGLEKSFMISKNAIIIVAALVGLVSGYVLLGIYNTYY